MELKICKV